MKTHKGNHIPDKCDLFGLIEGQNMNKLYVLYIEGCSSSELMWAISTHLESCINSNCPHERESWEVLSESFRDVARVAFGLSLGSPEVPFVSETSRRNESLAREFLLKMWVERKRDWQVRVLKLGSQSGQFHYFFVCETFRSCLR